MTQGHYIMREDGSVYHEPDFMKWACWTNNPANRRVASTRVGPWWVSTVFLGIDHNFGPSGPPVLFESMVFREDHRGRDFDSRRYCTYEEAKKGHEELVKKWESRPFDTKEYPDETKEYPDETP